MSPQQRVDLFQTQMDASGNQPQGRGLVDVIDSTAGINQPVLLHELYLLNCVIAEKTLSICHIHQLIICMKFYNGGPVY